MVIVREAHPYLLDLCSQIDAIGGELSGIDLRAFTFPSSAVELWQRVATVLLQRLNQLLDKVALVDETAAATPGWQDVGDVCFVSAVQLRGVRRQLTEQQGYEDLLVACESGLRHVRRMLWALRDAANVASGQSRVPSAAIFADEIAAALTVRRLFNKFRRSLRPCTSDDRAAVVQALQAAAHALAMLIGALEFPVVRASDRLLLLRLERRVIGWARDDGSVADGLRLLQDVATAAELLRDVNQRQELRAFDEQLAGRLAATMPANVNELTRYLGELGQLDGHDDELDGLIAIARNTMLDSLQLGQLRAALSRIAGVNDDYDYDSGHLRINI